MGAPTRRPLPSCPESSASASKPSPTTDHSSSESTPRGRSWVADGVSGTGERPGGGSDPMELASSRSDSIVSESSPRSPWEE